MHRHGDDAAEFRVAVFGVPDDADDLSRVLERVLGMHATDAHVQARAAPGVFLERLSRETAEALVAAIAETGLQAQVVAESELPCLHDASIIHNARCLEEGLEVLDLHGRIADRIAWGDIDLVSVGQTPHETGRRMVDAPMVALKSARRTERGAVEQVLSPGPQAWIIAANPFRVFHIDHKRMNYGYLADRKSRSATANFRVLIDDLVSHLTRTYLTPATRAWLGHGSVEEYSFASPDALERYTVLHLLIQRRSHAPVA